MDKQDKEDLEEFLELAKQGKQILEFEVNGPDIIFHTLNGKKIDDICLSFKFHIDGMQGIHGGEITKLYVNGNLIGRGALRDIKPVFYIALEKQGLDPERPLTMTPSGIDISTVDLENPYKRKNK